jgi:hypothetical protein
MTLHKIVAIFRILSRPGRVTCRYDAMIIPPAFRDGRRTEAVGGTWLPTVADRPGCLLPGQKPYWLI